MALKKSDIKPVKDGSNADSPKRRVQAQRKFAQGSGNSNQLAVPVREKDMKDNNRSTLSPPNVIPSKRPKTEDFLTFLCFRGTKALPSRLDFFNQSKVSGPSSSKKTVKATKDKVVKKVKSAKRPEQKIIKGRVVKVKAKALALSKHPSILKRLGASRLRTGLRSSGAVPFDSDVGIRSARRSVKNKANPDSVVSKRSCRMTTKTQQISGRSRLARKTKETAAIYMEILTKQLRSPDEEDAESESAEESPNKSEKKVIKKKNSQITEKSKTTKEVRVLRTGKEIGLKPIEKKSEPVKTPEKIATRETRQSKVKDEVQTRSKRMSMEFKKEDVKKAKIEVRKRSTRGKIEVSSDEEKVEAKKRNVKTKIDESLEKKDTKKKHVKASEESSEEEKVETRKRNVKNKDGSLERKKEVKKRNTRMEESSDEEIFVKKRNAVKPVKTEESEELKVEVKKKNIKAKSESSEDEVETRPNTRTTRSSPKKKENKVVIKKGVETRLRSKSNDFKEGENEERKLRSKPETIEKNSKTDKEKPNSSRNSELTRKCKPNVPKIETRNLRKSTVKYTEVEESSSESEYEIEPEIEKLPIKNLNKKIDRKISVDSHVSQTSVKSECKVVLETLNVTNEIKEKLKKEETESDSSDSEIEELKKLDNKRTLRKPPRSILPKRTSHSRLAKTLAEAYIDNESYTSDDDFFMDEIIDKNAPKVTIEAKDESVSQSIPEVPVEVKNTTKEDSKEIIKEDADAKKSISETWRQAFKNVKLPKPGRLSPAPMNSVAEPFVRKPFPRVEEVVEKKVQSPNRVEITKVEEKKMEMKTFVQLQYEKKSSNFISGLHTVDRFQPKEFKIKEPEVEIVDLVKKETGTGKHLNLPLAVEHTLRKMSPIAVRKAVPVKITRELPNILPSSTKDDMMIKKKVNMTAEEINRWLMDKTSDGKIEHMKGCGIFEKNQCECSFRTSGETMKHSIGVSHLINKSDDKIDHGVVEPPVQLKELDADSKFKTETISTCKVSDYCEKLLRPDKLKNRKSVESMTEEEMCEFDFRFERTSAPRDSGSEMSSPTLRDDASSDKSDRKPIFLQKRAKLKSINKNASAFSAENESSVYAFEPDLPPPIGKPFRQKSRKSSEDDSPSSSSKAVQVNIGTSCSTQTEVSNTNEAQTFYFPIQRKNTQELIQGVAVKLQSMEGPETKVIMRAKLVTKPSNQQSSSRFGVENSKTKKPEQKVRPLESCSTGSTSSNVPVVVVQPTLMPGTENSSTQTTVKEEPGQSANISSDAPEPKVTEPKAHFSKKQFPTQGSPPRIIEAPIFYPTEKEFLDPLEYIEMIAPLAQSFGMCRIVPPPNFKPECKVSDDMRFTAYNQYVHKMLNRWGPNVREMSAIRKYLETQSITLKQVPWIGGMEVDLPRLYQMVQNFGGLTEVIQKKRWVKVADAMKIPKSAQDRVTKLDDIYCKFLLPYDTLSHNERSLLLEQVELEWSERERRKELDEDDEEEEEESESDADSDDRDECITKGRSMALSQFYRIARNTMSMWFKESQPSAKEVETEFWKLVQSGSYHICVNSGSIDTSNHGYGFPTSKTSPTSRHPWNLKVLTNNPGSILRYLGPLIGVTIPTLHVGMLFSACCWYRDPHGLPWIEYLHTGANKIWYGVPDSWSENLKNAVKTLFPKFYRDKKIWIASDTAMVPPEMLLQQGVSLCQTVQEPGQFVVVFPKAYTSTICTGYLVAESVYFANSSWLDSTKEIFKDIQESSEPPVFPLEKLLFNIANDSRTNAQVLQQILPMIIELQNKEVSTRKELRSLGLTNTEKLSVKKKNHDDDDEYECDICRGNLFISMVTHSQEESDYCLEHAVEMIKKDKTIVSSCKLVYAYGEEYLEELVLKIKAKLDTKASKKATKTK